MSRIMAFALASSAAILLTTAAIAAPTKFIPYPLPNGAIIMDPTFSHDGTTLYAVRVTNKTE